MINYTEKQVYMLRRGFWMHNQLVDILLWLVVRSQEINIINLLTGQGFRSAVRGLGPPPLTGTGLSPEDV